MIRSLAAALCLTTGISLAIASPLAAQEAIRSKPTALPVNDATPAPKDIPYPGGTIKLEVDASDTTQRIFRVKETIPVATSGPMTLLMPEWLPGNHAPRGQLEKLSGLTFTADGKPLSWKRDPLNVYGFVIDVPQGTKQVVAQFQFLSATAGNQGRVVVTPKMQNIQWEAVSLYPAGYYTRQIPVQATVTYPAGWQAATALRGKRTGDTVAYDVIDYEALQDSPVFAGEHFKAVDLGNNVTLNIVADDADELVYTPEQIAKHKRLVDEAGALFGSYHFDHYDFLLAITDEMGGIGLEHHRSSENQVEPGYFKKWSDGEALLDRNLLPHEFTHSWDGKFRRPDLLWTPDFRTPMQDNLLWVYEGQTQFWGYVLGARSGLFTKQETLDAYAQIAAKLDTTVGRQWRPMEDTTHDPIISARRPKGWVSWQRSEDYYNEGLMIWLEADAIIRKQTRGAKGLDDFAKAFFGVKPGDWGELVYNRQDVINTLNGIAPYDWAGFFQTYVDSPTRETPKGGFTMGGYKLVYGDTPNAITKAAEGANKIVDQSYGIGLIVKNDGEISSVIWDSPAFKAGLLVGAKIVAVNGDEYSGDVFKAAIKAKAPFQIILKKDKYYRTLSLDYSGGLRYPRLEKTGEGEGSLDKLLKPKT
ncbi:MULTISPECIES: M61 family metallopeptidase [unclassified Sphingobium]|uniref:M61 family metallopeptidase n=1 Tax=unclassified Sphingobium TaxID=2611147 RepID=UPI000D16B088|nr:MULTISPECIES: M61 family metallopeptidase [unclassified Sphingobium]MBG6118084.1 putative metalloprotease with PDZ domain [Sphingobium sp. JAI105]PSO10287.1 peptidase M61 [Sphingobium sp. AEW4]TWC99932.1 putative metalloprotease with PDZ domain [Sphingobium sp. AEW010]TWD19101.1 putative metalloprotease with PDZ domain [Sphingobium sp. AEW013]TWD22000.1 putative metalloprotease with PDZ domain [Sphingobium sp. AEW001]